MAGHILDRPRMCCKGSSGFPPYVPTKVPSRGSQHGLESKLFPQASPCLPKRNEPLKIHPPCSAVCSFLKVSCVVVVALQHVVRV